MSSRDIQRVSELKKLFDEQLEKVDHSKSFQARMQEAAKRMDKLVGPEWRGEAKVPEIEIVEVELTKGQPAQDPRSFYERVHHEMNEEGLNFHDNEDELDTHEAKSKRQESLKDQLMCGFKSLLDNIWKH